jgi:anti-anti-sigma regulatory factor
VTGRSGGTDRPTSRVERAPLRGAPGVLVHGRVDIATTAEPTAVLDAAIPDSRCASVLDLSDVDILDSSGVNVVLRARAVVGPSD